VSATLEGAAPVRTLQRGPWRQLEEGALVVAIAAMALVPIAELLLRMVFHTGIFGAASIVQHLGLAIAMIGGAVAAREDRLLTISALRGFLDERKRKIVAVVANSLGACVCALLVAAGIEFVVAERASGSILAYGVRTWWIEALLPAGFALIGWRLIARIAPGALPRAAGLGLAVLLVVLAHALPTLPHATLVPSLAILAAGALLGTPLFAVLSGTALLLFWHQGLPLASIAIDHYRTVVNPTLPAIPLFTLAGYLMAESGAPRRLVEVFDALFGSSRGGPAIVTVLACTFFTSFTGASGATVLALGGLVMPLLLSSGYAPRPALGLATSAGLPGTLLMPALPLILYAIVAGVDIRDMFLAGVLPSILMASIVIAWGIHMRPRNVERPAPFDWRRVRVAIGAAKWELSVPLVAMLSLASGMATPVESAALTALYVFIVTVAVRRDLHLRRDAPRVAAECGLIVGGILLIMGVALGLTDFLVDAQVPEKIVAWAGTAGGDRHLFLLGLNLFLLVAGCVIEIYPAIIVLVPLVAPLGQAFGIDPVHLGIIFLANMELGYLTPLVGLNLFFASYRFGKPVGEIFRSVLPVFVALAVGVLAITYIPWLSLALLSPR
jgi:tripartite ATP-independent transporter DctM subunit